MIRFTAIFNVFIFNQSQLIGIFDNFTQLSDYKRVSVGTSTSAVQVSNLNLSNICIPEG
jgi:hypothetical protein